MEAPESPQEPRNRQAKWCGGPCGRFLPLEAFYRNGKGTPNTECKQCHRITARECARKVKALKRQRKYQRERYQTDPLYREAKLHRMREAYWAKKLLTL